MSDHDHVSEVEVAAWVDGELAAPERSRVDSHMSHCTTCQEMSDRMRAVGAVMRRELPARRAPDALRQRVTLAAKSSGRSAHAWNPIVLAAAAAIAIAIFGTWQVALRRSAGNVVTDEVFTSHVRSLMASHLTDVATSDQHTVKPWFNGKLDYSPPVNDFAGRGYPLVGGRLDYVADRAVAALVYSRRQHVINVLLWPRGRTAEAATSSATRQGYHLLHWETTAYSYWIVSDLGEAELEEFRGLLQSADSALR